MDDHAFSSETSLVSTPLTGGNYIAWCQAMSLALLARNKLGFVDGTILKPPEGDPKLSSWKESNHLVLSWIMNSLHEDLVVPSAYKDEEVFAAAADVWSDLRDRFSPTSGLRIFHLQSAIATHKQDIGDSLVAYFNKFKSLCDQLSICLSTTASCSACGATEVGPRQQVQQLMQFLMGLHETYDSLRREIVLMIPLPSVDDAYALLLLEDETQHDELGRPKDDATVLAPTKSNHAADHARCAFCIITGHTIETCNQLFGDHLKDHDAKQECFNLFDLITSFTVAAERGAERKMEIKHFSHEHSLSLYDVKDARYMCEGCGIVSIPPVYSCNRCRSNRDSYLLDELCARLPRNMSYPAHPQHPLILLLKPPIQNGKTVCAACGSVCKAFLFCCPICQFYLDIHCASVPYALRHEFHPHPLTLGGSSISSSDCDGCGLPIQGVSFSCSDCIYELHVNCATLTSTTIMGRHQHSLYLSCTNHSGDDSLCSICRKKFNRPSWFYFCAHCEFLVHVKCLGLDFPRYEWNSEDRIMWLPEPAPQRGIQVTRKSVKSYKKEEKKENDEENHEHQHPLVLINEIERTKSFCSWCQQLLSGPTYGCADCNHYLHELCYKSPRKINHPFHPKHPLTLTSRIATGRRTLCKACNNFMGGNVFSCEACNTDLLHAECTLLPHQATVADIHEHPLSLLYTMEDDGLNEHYCWACEEQGLQQLRVFSEDDIDAAAEALNDGLESTTNYVKDKDEWLCIFT
ncbi:hypothetical protein RJ639_022793 [Escallonia herrerae]|uniref:Zinc finger PHD-type domain-containing protein n=1 Tax=Escallonia herrerae TaxID=1293975 RepID=A0AA89AEC3_9ASTE|nr:hypothetical protein RJ639_022793 [Escallonia herrerae]